MGGAIRKSDAIRPLIWVIEMKKQRAPSHFFRSAIVVDINTSDALE